MATKQHHKAQNSRYGGCAGLIMFIEEVIQIVNQRVYFHQHISSSFSFKDAQFVESVSNQLSNGNALTEKQANLALIILEKSKGWIREFISEIDSVLESPKWQYPFRVLSEIKSVKIQKELSTDKPIHVYFPYDATLVDLFKKRNVGLHNAHRGVWNIDKKCWCFGLTEKTVAWLGDTLLPKNFQVDLDFLEYYQSISEIHENIEDHMPMVSITDGIYHLKNAHKNIPELSTTSLPHALFYARKYGITTWDDNVESQCQTLNNTTKTILSKTNKDTVWFNSTVTKIDDFADLLRYAGPTIICVPGGSELDLTKNWVNLALSLGIAIENISVLFRLPHEQASFNQYVRDQGLNNPIIDTTQIVFVSTKINKPLVKSGIQFSTMINLGHYNYVHFSMSVLASSLPNVIHYSIKEPIIPRRWQQQEL